MKHCFSCNLSKLESEFSINKSKKDGLQSSCKECRSKYLKKWYKNNSTLQKNRARQSKEKIAEYVRHLKTTQSCVDCGNFYHYSQMDFDHLRDKKFCISKATHSGIELAKKEIAKCELVCANCHRLRTWNRRQHRR